MGQQASGASQSLDEYQESIQIMSGRRGLVSKEQDAAAVAAKRGRLRYYLDGQSTSVGRYVLEQSLFLLLGGIPSLIDIGLRAVAYKMILRTRGKVAIENNVRLCMPHNITLGRDVYLDYGVYLHACPKGIFIGDGTFVMHNAELHVYNFRDLPHSGIWVGENCFIGEFSIIRGQGGVTIGNHVLLAP